MDFILNEVELKKAAREKQRIETLKKEGKKDEEIQKILPSQKPKKEVIVCRNATDIQKRKLDRLMSDMSKDAYIPEPRKEWKPREAPEFVRHVMGSSAGAGSGEFHVYRGIRKREKKRQDYLDRKAMKEDLDVAYQEKLDNNKQKAEEITAKKRAKRQKKKQKKMMAKKMKQNKDETNETDEKHDVKASESESESEEEHFVIGGK